MAKLVTIRAEFTGPPGDALAPVAEAVGEATHEAAEAIAAFIRRVNQGTGRSANSVRGEHKEGSTSGVVVLDVPYGEWVRPAGQAPHQYTTMPILAEHAMVEAMAKPGVAEAVAADLVRFIKEADVG